MTVGCKLPRLRWKGASAWFDHGGQPRRWEALGRNLAAIARRYDELIARAGAPGTVDAMLADCLKALAGKVAPGTLRNYRVYRKHLSAVFGHLPADDQTHMNQATVRRYLLRCPRMTFRNEIGLLSLAYANWMDEDPPRLTFNPCYGVRVDRKGSKRTRLLHEEELDAIIAASGEREQVAWELQYAIGVRIGDLCRLRWADFGNSHEAQKTGARQRWTVTPPLRAILDRAKALQARVASPYVLCDAAGQPWRPDNLRRHFHAARKAAGIEDAKPHDIRAKAITDVDAQGGDAQGFAGHRQRQTTETYLRDRRAKVVTPIARRKA